MSGGVHLHEKGKISRTPASFFPTTTHNVKPSQVAENYGLNLMAQCYENPHRDVRKDDLLSSLRATYNRSCGAGNG
jgi:hypothetical protein